MSDPSWVQPLTVLAGSLGGAALGFIGSAWNQRRSDERAARRERQARQEERDATLIAERRSFELATFARLPKAMQQRARATAKVLLFYISTLEEHGTLARDTPSDETDFANSVDLMILVSEVLDEHVRNTLDAARSELSAMHLPPWDWKDRSSEDLIAEMQKRLQRMNVLVPEAYAVLNDYRRSLYV